MTDGSPPGGTSASKYTPRRTRSQVNGPSESSSPTSVKKGGMICPHCHLVGHITTRAAACLQNKSRITPSTTTDNGKINDFEDIKDVSMLEDEDTSNSSGQFIDRTNSSEHCNYSQL